MLPVEPKPGCFPPSAPQCVPRPSSGLSPCSLTPTSSAPSSVRQGFPERLAHRPQLTAPWAPGLRRQPPEPSLPCRSQEPRQGREPLADGLRGSAVRRPREAAGPPALCYGRGIVRKEKSLNFILWMTRLRSTEAHSHSPRSRIKRWQCREEASHLVLPRTPWRPPLPLLWPERAGAASRAAGVAPGRFLPCPTSEPTRTTSFVSSFQSGALWGEHLAASRSPSLKKPRVAFLN